MVSVTKYSTAQAQVDSGVPYKNWSYLYRLGANDNLDAYCNDIGTSDGTYNRPGPIKVNTFGFNIPSDARIDSITVEYEHYKISHSSETAHMSIAAPIVSLNGVGAPSLTGNAPPTSRTVYSKTWNRSSTWQPTPDQVNSSGFGAALTYPKNTSGNPGDLAVDFIRITVNYSLPTYSIAMSTPTAKVLSEPVTLDITVNNTNSINANGYATVNLNIPSGLSYASHSGPGTYSNGVWIAKLTNSTATLSITFNTVASGSQTLTATESSTGVNLSRTVTVNNPTYDLSSTLPASVVQAATFTYTVKIKVNSSAITNTEVNIPFTGGLSHISSSGDGTYNSSTGVWNAIFVNREATLTITAAAATVGNVSQTITQGAGATLVSITNTVNVISSSLTTTYNAIVPFSDDILSELEDGREYVAAFYARIVDSQNRAYFPGPKNNRFSILQGTDEILSTQISNTGVTELLTARFTYHEGMNHSFKFYAGYVGYFQADIGVEFSQEPTIVPLEYYNGFEDLQALFTNRTSLLSNDTFAEINLNSLQKSGTYIFSDINTAGLETDETILFQGFKISMDCVLTGNTIVTMGFYSEKEGLLFESDQQSTVLTAENNQIILGDVYDRWGLRTNEIDLTQLKFFIQLQNLTTSAINVLLNNVELTIYYTLDQTGGALGCVIEGDHSSLFNIILDEDTIPRGTDNEVNYSDITGADGEYATRSNIKSKTIKLKFNLISECMDFSNALMDRVIQFFSNERDKLNKPIPKTLIFDYDPEKQYNYILEKPITANRKFEDFECEAELIIPDGVAESVNPKITGMVGVNNSITRVFPVIQLLTDGSEEIIITESIENQSMTILHQFSANTVLILDTKTKTLADNDGNDYTSYIDINSDRLVLNKQYNFSGTTGAIVQQISFKERY